MFRKGNRVHAVFLGEKKVFWKICEKASGPCPQPASLFLLKLDALGAGEFSLVDK